MKPNFMISTLNCRCVYHKEALNFQPQKFKCVHYNEASLYAFNFKL